MFLIFVLISIIFAWIILFCTRHAVFWEKMEKQRTQSSFSSAWAWWAAIFSTWARRIPGFYRKKRDPKFDSNKNVVFDCNKNFVCALIWTCAGGNIFFYCTKGHAVYFTAIFCGRNLETNIFSRMAFFTLSEAKKWGFSTHLDAAVQTVAMNVMNPGGEY